MGFNSGFKGLIVEETAGFTQNWYWS